MVCITIRSFDLKYISEKSLCKPVGRYNYNNFNVDTDYKLQRTKNPTLLDCEYNKTHLYSIKRKEKNS